MGYVGLAIRIRNPSNFWTQNPNPQFKFKRLKNGDWYKLDFLLIKKTFKNIARIRNPRINPLFFEGHFCKNPNPNSAQKLGGLPTLRSSIMQGQG